MRSMISIVKMDKEHANASLIRLSIYVKSLRPIVQIEAIESNSQKHIRSYIKKEVFAILLRF
jgi:hypothetical protein